jgi:hypothetical protein
MAKRGRPAKVKEPVVVAPKVLINNAPVPEFKAPPPMSKETQDAMTQQLRAKFEYLQSQNNEKSQFKGYTKDGDKMFGNPLDGFDDAAVAQLKEMVTSELGSPRVAELFNEPVHPSSNNNGVSVQLGNKNITINTQVDNNKQSISIDIDDIFGLK